MLTDGAWNGKPAIIVGGGWSLKNYDFGRLQGVPSVIAINVAFVRVPTAAVAISEDERVFKQFPTRYQDFRGEKIYSCPDVSYAEAVRVVVPDVRIIPQRDKRYGWPRSLSEGLSTSSNSGIPALNLADILGADPIYLLGIDCREGGEGNKNYHSLYPPEWRAPSAPSSFASDFEHWAALHLKHRRVINVINPEWPSALSCWPTMTLAEFSSLWTPTPTPENPC